MVRSMMQDLEIPQPFGTANFAANEFDKLIEYHILGDTLVEPNETLTLTLRTATNCSIVQSTATVTVVNDDVTPPPSSSPFVHRYPLQIEFGFGGKHYPTVYVLTIWDK